MITDEQLAEWRARIEHGPWCGFCGGVIAKESHPALLAEVERLRAEVARLESEVDALNARIGGML